MKTTKNIKVPAKVVDQVIGQEEAVNIIKKAALQRRHVLLIGEPGTGKSMLGIALSELLPKSELQDVIAYPNPNDENEPIIKTVEGGKGREEIQKAQMDSKQLFKNMRFLSFILAIIVMIAPWWARWYYKSDVMFTAFFIGGMMFLVAFSIMMNLGPKAMGGGKTIPPKLIVDNFNKKNAPFFDATSAHAGALLGDVLHDPLQCFYQEQNLVKLSSKNADNTEINKEIDNIFTKHKNKLIKKDHNNYEALHFPKNELFVLGEKNGSFSPVEVLSSNRHDHDGEMIKLTTSENKELIVTPEHKVALSKNGKIVYTEAQNIKEGDQVISRAEDIIIDEQDIINTYDERQQELARSYYNYLNLKGKNPKWGYKRLATKLSVSYGRTRWWWDNNSAPVPVQTVEWLKERGLLPLKIDNPKLPIIAKIIGSSFGDGGIFENLNAIFLSSSELEATEEFGKDLKEIFSKEISKNSRTIEGGIEGHSWCYQNANRNVIRFLAALGSPVGKKTNLKFSVPTWVYLSESFKDEFFSSLMGSELGVPKVHKQKNRLDMLSLGITGTSYTVESKVRFLNELQRYLENKNIKSTSIHQREGKTEGTILCRLMISIKFDNVVRFIKSTKMNYCNYKQDKLINTINEFRILKKEKYNELIEKGYGAEHIMKLLQLTPSSLYTILNEEEIVA